MKKLITIATVTLLSLSTVSYAAPASSNMESEIARASGANQRAQTPSRLFNTVYDYDSLKDAIMKSIRSGTPILIEFYASWCHYCQAADANVFSDPTVQAAMEGITAIRVDASEGNQEQTSMMDIYSVTGFPTFIVYDKTGAMRKPTELDQGVTKPAMLRLLNSLKR